MPRLLVSLGLGIVVAAVGLVVYFGLFGFGLEENLGLHLMTKARSERRAPDDVVVIDLDKPAADRLGLALDPDEWPRTVHARLVERLAAAGAAVIVFDVFFREARGETEDRALAAAIERAGNVILFAYLRRERAEVPIPGQESRAINVEHLVLPTTAIVSSAAGIAPLPLPKTGARVSQFWSFRRSAGDMPTLPAMALQLYALEAYDDFLRLLNAVDPQAAAGLPVERSAISRNGELSQLMISLKEIFVSSPDLAQALLDQVGSDPHLAGRPDHRRRLTAMIHLYYAGNLHYLNFYGPPHSVTTVSYADALDADTAPLDLHGKVAFIGYSAGFQPDQKDGFHTIYSQPDGLDISGVEIAATAFANLLEQSTIRPLEPLPFILVVIGYGLVAAFAARRGSVMRSVGLSVVLPLGYGAVCFGLFQAHQLWLPLTVPVLIQSPAALVAGLATAYWETNRERNRIRQAFGHYIPNQVVDQLLRGPGTPHSHQELQYGICLATDAEQYTAVAEAMPAGELQKYMNRYYAELFGPVRAHGGVVSDVIGDAMLAIWSGAQNDPGLRAHACRAALEIARAAESFNHGNGPRLPTRIGLHAGDLALGHVGALDHFEYRAVGDIVNTASRIQGVNKVVGTRIVVSPMVIAGLTGFVTRELGSFRLAGKRQALTLYELIGEAEDMDPDLERVTQKFAEGLVAYRSRAWAEARVVFSEILRIRPADGPARFYYELCETEGSRRPSLPWDPTITLTVK
ncbi:MAG: adenylate/guanylate cyclase domain-containing protein [Gammaproteobacteria bacterium]|jgi:adenylate cyclase